MAFNINFPFKRISTKLTVQDKIHLTKEKQTLLKGLLEGAASRDTMDLPTNEAEQTDMRKLHSIIFARSLKKSKKYP